MESFPSFEIMESILKSLKEAINENDHKQIINIFKQNVEGYIS